MQKMSPYLSDKIKVISLIAITMVIYIHTYYTEGENYTLFMSLQRFFGGVGLSGIANPLFYLISGYLFFININSVYECFPKIKKRFHTLFIPYILANTLAFILYAFLDGISRLSLALYNVVNFHILNWLQLDLITLLKNIYWEPVAFQLWFVRDMILFVLLTPIIFYILKFCSQKKWTSLLLLFILILYYFVTSHHVIWMAIGGIISMSNIINIAEYCPTKQKDIVMYISAAIFIFFVVCNSFNIYTLKYGYALFGVIAFWLLYDKIAKGQLYCTNQKLAKACSLSFFIYLIHEPILLIFKKVPLLIFNNEITLTIYFLTVPIVFVTITIFIGNLLRKYIPKFFSIYVGGR